jgi:hypothetical protein
MSVTPRGPLLAWVRSWLAPHSSATAAPAAKSDYEAYLELLEQICRELRPARVLEFGSGVSTRIFARHAAVTTMEYDPPGDWYANEVASDDDIERVTFRFVKPETSAWPHNLLASLYALIAEELKEDPAREFKIVNGHPPLWDIAFVDGAVHMEGLVVDQRFPGWSPGDLSYLTRMTVAGLCSLVAKRVIVDDLSYMPPLARSRVEQRGRLFILHATA